MGGGGGGGGGGGSEGSLLVIMFITSFFKAGLQPHLCISPLACNKGVKAGIQANLIVWK